MSSKLISKLIGNGHLCENLGLLDSVKYILNKLYERESSNYHQNMNILKNLINYNNYNNNVSNFDELNNINVYEHLRWTFKIVKIS